MKKSTAASLMFSLSACLLQAVETEKPYLALPGKILVVDQLDGPMKDPWKLAKGKWEPTDGVTRCTFLPEDQHGAVAAISEKGLLDFSLSYDFKFEGSTNQSVAVDGDGGHILRLTVTSKSVSFGSDGNDVYEPMSFAKFPVNFKDGDWHSVRMEVVGDTVFAKVDKLVAYGVSDLFKAPKSGIRLCVGNGVVDYRNFTFHEASLNPDWAKMKLKLPKPLTESVLKATGTGGENAEGSKGKKKHGGKGKPGKE